MKWFKFYGQDYLSDPKMLTLNACERSCWMTILAYGSVNDNGVIKFLSEEQLMLQAGVNPMSDEWEATKGVLKKLEKLQMITLDNEDITICNWSKRQDTSLTSYERVKRHREKMKNETDDNVSDNTKITLEENRREEKRRDKSIKSEETLTKKTEDFIKSIKKLLVGKTLSNSQAEEIKKFASYWTEPNKSNTKLRFEMEKTWDLERRLSRWMNNSTGFDSSKKVNVARA